LVLLHGILCSELVWRHVVPLLAEDFDVIAPTLTGHRGGPEPSARPVHIVDFADDLERQLDELGVGRVHLAGNSLGGWIGLDLARRGRAHSVCAISPAGVWDEEDSDHDRVIRTLRRSVRDARLGRPFSGSLANIALGRRWALRLVAVHGERVHPSEFVEVGADVRGCSVYEDFLADDKQLESLDPAPCPLTLAWAAEDRLFPAELYGPMFRDLIPGAEFRVLDGVGHIPMFDDPQLVAETIRASATPSA
jgi:pimeloyl-ACP methyl ester carboxylesterase